MKSLKTNSLDIIYITPAGKQMTIITCQDRTASCGESNQIMRLRHKQEARNEDKQHVCINYQKIKTAKFHLTSRSQVKISHFTFLMKPT